MGSTAELKVVATEEAPIATLLFDHPRQTLVVFSQDLMLVQHTVDANTGLVSKSTEAKLAGREMAGACWVAPSTLAIGTSQNSIRLWDLAENELSMLQVKQTNQRINSVTCDLTQGLIVGGCSDSSVFVWQLQPDKTEEVESFSDKWEQWPGIDVGSVGQFSSVLIGGGKGMIAVQGDAGVSILRRQAMNTAFGGNTSAVQVSSTRIVVQSSTMVTPLETDLTIKGLSANGNFVAIWSGTQVGIYELIKAHKVTRSVGLFKSDSNNVQVLNETAFVMQGPNVLGLSYTGATKQTLRVAEGDSPVTCIGVNADFLVAATASCNLIVWDMGKHQARPLCPPKSVKDDVDAITDVKVNSTGTLVSFLAETGGQPDSSIWIWDTVNNAVHTYDFSSTHRVPISHVWESEESQMLAVEATQSLSENSASADTVLNEAVTMFVTAEEGVIVQHRIPLAPTDGALIGITVPHLIHVDKKQDGAGATVKRVIPSFDGLEGAAEDVKTAMMAFSFNLAINNMDEAFKAVRAIKNEKVWESMAKMCVQSRRMDVAGVCIGSMGNAVGARALREASTDAEPEVAAACLASHLGMNDVAESLYKESGRYDLLNIFYQNSARWDEALEVAKRNDRQHLRTTQYNYGKFLEASGKMKEAERRYEASYGALVLSFSLSSLPPLPPFALHYYQWPLLDRMVRSRLLSILGPWRLSGLKPTHTCDTLALSLLLSTLFHDAATLQANARFRSAKNVLR
jgi:intraflagellar transport protein 140